MSKTERKSLTVRVTLEEDNEITKRATASNMKKNDYMVRAALSGTPNNERALSTLMNRLCVLENILKTSPDMNTMREQVEAWRSGTIAMMEEVISWR